jgi:hypothetical protein
MSSQAQKCCVFLLRGNARRTRRVAQLLHHWVNGFSCSFCPCSPLASRLASWCVPNQAQLLFGFLEPATSTSAVADVPVNLASLHRSPTSQLAMPPEGSTSPWGARWVSGSMPPYSSPQQLSAITKPHPCRPCLAELHSSQPHWHCKAPLMSAMLAHNSMLRHTAPAFTCVALCVPAAPSLLWWWWWQASGGPPVLSVGQSDVL